MKKLLAAMITVAVLLTGCGIQSADDYYNIESASSDMSVLVSVDCSDILENMSELESGLEKYIPEYGLIFPDTDYPLLEGETVYDLIVRIARENGMQLETKGFFGNYEVEGIGFIYNSTCADGRWIYKVNGKTGPAVCSGYKLKDGDMVQWIYVCGS